MDVGPNRDLVGGCLALLLLLVLHVFDVFFKIAPSAEWNLIISIITQHQSMFFRTACSTVYVVSHNEYDQCSKTGR